MQIAANELPDVCPDSQDHLSRNCLASRRADFSFSTISAIAGRAPSLRRRRARGFQRAGRFLFDNLLLFGLFNARRLDGRRSDATGPRCEARAVTNVMPQCVELAVG